MLSKQIRSLMRPFVRQYDTCLPRYFSIRLNRLFVFRIFRAVNDADEAVNDACPI